MRSVGLIGVCVVVLLFAARDASGQVVKEPELDKIPEEYRDKRMPKGWWTDPKVIAEGKEIFEGKVDAQVFCFVCHGLDGKPMLPEARDMRDASYVSKMPDRYWYWRISEGVPNTQMPAWKGKLTEDQIWKVMAYEHHFSHGGKAEEHIHQ